MLRDLPLKILLIAGFLVSGLIPLMAVSLSSLSAAREELNAQALRQLESVRDMKRSQLVRHYDERLHRLRTLADAARRGDLPEMARQNGYARLLRMAADEPVFLEGASGAPCPTLVALWDQARQADAPILSDIAVCRPEAPSPSQFAAVRLGEPDQRAGVLVAELDPETVVAIMRERSGMGRTGETYLVGPDGRMRSDSYLDPEAHSVRASFFGTVEANGVDTHATRQAFAGHAASEPLIDYRGRAVLSAYRPVALHGLTWAVIAEIDENEINEKISKALDPRVGLIIGLSIVLLLVLALSLSQYVSTSVQRVMGELRRLIDKVLRGHLEARGQPEDVAFDFRGVMRKINDLIAALVEQTEEKRRLEEVVQYNQRMESVGTLAGGIAHDFNNILTYMVTFADLVEAELAPGSPAEAHMREILAGIDRAGDLVGQIMLFGRQMKREKRPVRVALIVKEALKLLKATLPKSIKVVRHIPDEELLLMEDPTQLHQIVMNLCTNAYQAMQSTGGELRVSVERVPVATGEVAELPAGVYCRICVSDTGCGMDAAVMARMFEPFYTTKPQGQGTGMGLAVVHGIVAHSGGAITYDSAPGEGSTAYVYLPLPEDELTALPEVQPPEAVPGTGHILVVDDEEAIGRATRFVLEGLGYTVEVFDSAPAALAAFLARPDDFDAVVTDLSMPELGGMELTRRLLARRPELPVILTTGYSEMMTPERAESLGAAALLLKPYRAPELSRLLREALTRAES